MINGMYFQDGRVSMAGKMAMVSELFELGVINSEDAAKACQVIIGQHAKKRPTDDGTGPEDSTTIIKSTIK